MSTVLPLLEKHYVARSWTRMDAVPFHEIDNIDMPTEHSTLDFFSLRSSAAGTTEQHLERLQGDTDRIAQALKSVLVWDLEVLGAGALDLLGTGGALHTLTEDWHGFKAGATVMEFYVRDETNTLGVVYLVENI